MSEKVRHIPLNLGEKRNIRQLTTIFQERGLHGADLEQHVIHTLRSSRPKSLNMQVTDTMISSVIQDWLKRKVS